MTLNKSSLLTHLDTITKFVNDRIAQDQSYINIDQKLKELNDFLKTDKLTLQILGYDSSQIQSLQKLLETNSELLDNYQLKTSILPEIPDPNSSPLPSLVLQPYDRTKKPTRYELKTAYTQIIGRNPSAAQILLPDNLYLTSGSHLEIKPSAGGNWQIRDLDSRNGTFINGNPTKSQDWYTLKPQDLICLGSASQAPGSSVLIFEVPEQDYVESAILETQKLLDSNILCLVVSSQTFSENIQRVLDLIGNSHFCKLFIVIDRLGEISDNTFTETLAIIRDYAQQKLQTTSFEIFSLLLKPFVPSSGATVVIPNAQPEFEQFSDMLKEFAKDQTVLAQWGNTKLKQIVEQIEAVLLKYIDDFNEKLQQDEQRFKEFSERNLKKDAEKVYKKVDGDRDAFFRKIKTELSQSKSSLLDEFRKSSLPYKIQKFTKQLEANISNQGGFCYVQLKIGASKEASYNVHAMATDLCNTELTQWASAEWNRIRQEYANGGLDQFFKRSYDSLNFIPDFSLEKDGFSTAQSLSIQSVLEVSNVEPTIEMRFKQANVWSYMSKNLKGQIITILGTITLLGTGFTDQLGKTSKEVLLPVLIPITCAIVWLSYKQEKETKVEEVVEKLQKDISSYYKSYVKGLVDRVVQRIEGLVESEEKRFRETLETVKETYETYNAELNRTEKQLKAQIDEMKRSGQTILEKDLIELRKIKQSL